MCTASSHIIPTCNTANSNHSHFKVTAVYAAVCGPRRSGKGEGGWPEGLFVFLVLYRFVHVATTLLSVTADSAACSSAAAGAGSKRVGGLTFRQHTAAFATDKSVISWLGS